MQKDDRTSGEKRITRRGFLRKTAATAGAASLVAGSLNRLMADDGKAEVRGPRVVQIRSEQVVTTRGIHEELLGDLLEILLTRLTGKDDVDKAWKSILKPTDTIGLKFNRSGADGLATTDAMLRVLVKSLGDAGFSPEKIYTAEVSPAVRQETGTLSPSSSWTDEEFDFGSGRDNLAAWLDQVTALINVPYLKHHNICGMTCCLKNLSHALIKHPAQYHDNKCSPYIGDIVALPQIRDKLRLNIVNALRVVFDNGPEASEDFIWNAGVLLGGTDPVAVDSAGLHLLDHVRTTLNLPKIREEDGSLPYLTAATESGVGESKLYNIELRKLKL